jgi:hypothetical protein
MTAWCSASPWLDPFLAVLALFVALVVLVYVVVHFFHVHR